MLDRGVSLAQSVEVAEKRAKDLQSSTGSVNKVHKLSRKAATSGIERKSTHNKDKKVPVCYWCGDKYLATNFTSYQKNATYVGNKAT